MWPRRRKLAVPRGAHFAVGVGEVIGLFGENRFGKSTLMPILVGAVAADSGNINVTGAVGIAAVRPRSNTAAGAFRPHGSQRRPLPDHAEGPRQ